jgi:hypothetical protein
MDWWRRLVVRLFGHSRPANGGAGEALRESRRLRAATRPVIDRAAALAAAYEQGDAALAGERGGA